MLLLYILLLQDIQYADIDHMDERKDFTVNNDNFTGLNSYFESLQNDGMHIIIILVSICLSIRFLFVRK